MAELTSFSIKLAYLLLHEECSSKIRDVSEILFRSSTSKIKSQPMYTQITKTHTKELRSNTMIRPNKMLATGSCRLQRM